MRIGLTGTPGTGKTSVSRVLGERMHCKIYNVNDLARENNFIKGKDEERDADIVDIDKLREVEIPDYTIVEGHLSQYIENIDFIVVLRCDPLELKERLEERDWSKDKVRENLEAEAMSIITKESQDIHENVYEIDTTGKDSLEVADNIIELINAEDRNSYKPRVDYLERLEEI